MTLNCNRVEQLNEPLKKHCLHCLSKSMWTSLSFHSYPSTPYKQKYLDSTIHPLVFLPYIPSLVFLATLFSQNYVDPSFKPTSFFISFCSNNKNDAFSISVIFTGWFLSIHTFPFCPFQHPNLWPVSSFIPESLIFLLKDQVNVCFRASR